MDLQGMSLAELWGQLEAEMHGSLPREWWDICDEVVDLRAELKKRCEAWTVAGLASDIQGALCGCPTFEGVKLHWSACPVVGKAGITEAKSICPKCRQEVPWLLCGPGLTPCYQCLASRQPAQAGYEYTGEWRKPTNDEYYLPFDCVAVFQCRIGTMAPSHEVDAGRRWILRKVEEPKPVTRSNLNVAMHGVFRRIGNITRRVEALEQQETP